MKWMSGIITLLTLTALAEPEFVRPELQNISQSGKLVTLNIVPKAKTLLFSVVGKPSLAIDLENAQVDVLILGRERKRPLNISRVSSGEYVSEPINSNEAMNMEVRVKVGKDTEKFDVSIPQR